MTPWLRNVTHVMRYDARALWPFFALHVAVLVYGVLQARGVVAFPESSNGSVVLLYGTAMLFSALLVHRHTPASHSAHWNGLPHDRSAVWAAKWIVLALLLACVVVALLVSASGQPDPQGIIGHFASARAASLSAAIGAAALVAATRRELRTVLLLLLALPLLSIPCVLLAALLLPKPIAEFLLHPAALFGATVMAAGVSWWLYEQRGVSSTAATHVLLGSAMLFTGVTVTRGPTPTLSAYDRSTVQIRESNAVLNLDNVTVFAERDSTSHEADYSSLRLSMQGAPTELRAEWLFASEKDDARALLRMTPVVVLTSTNPRRLWTFRSELFTPPLPITPTARWLGAPVSTNGSVATAASATPSEWFVQAGVLSEIDQAKGPVDGVVRFSRPVIIARLPFVTGTRSDLPDRQFVISGRGGGELLCQDEPRGARCGMSFRNNSLVRLHMRTTLPESEPSLSFALFNPSRSEAIELRADFSQTRRRSPGLLFLPPDMLTMDWLLVPSYLGSATGKLDDAWLSGAELIIARWEPVGALPVPISNEAATRSSSVARVR